MIGERIGPTLLLTGLSLIIGFSLAIGGLVRIVILAVYAIFAQVISPHNPYEITNAFSATPLSQHLLGTNQVGRDVLSRVIYGARISLTVLTSQPWLWLPP